MEQRISLISLGVADLATSRTFYETMGWKIATEKDADKIVAFNVQAMSLALYPRPLLAEDACVPMPEKGHPPFTLAYNVRSEAEADAVMAEAEKAGASIVKPAEKTFWGGYSGYFADPDGFLWEVAYNPFSPLDENGAFQWVTS